MCHLVASQVFALAAAWGMLVQHGARSWADLEVQACRPHPPQAFWRSCNRAQGQQHVLFLAHAFKVPC